jgi:hypothetical protein
LDQELEPQQQRYLGDPRHTIDYNRLVNLHQDLAIGQLHLSVLRQSSRTYHEGFHEPEPNLDWDEQKGLELLPLPRQVLRDSFPQISEHNHYKLVVQNTHLRYQYQFEQ